MHQVCLDHLAHWDFPVSMELQVKLDLLAHQVPKVKEDLSDSLVKWDPRECQEDMD